MDDIDLDNYGRRLNRLREWNNDDDDDPEWGGYEHETSFGGDGWRNESLLEFNRDHPGGEIPNARRNAGAMRRAYTTDVKDLLREFLGINVNKKDGKNSESLIERIKLTVNQKREVNGAEFDGVKIIVREKDG